MLLDSKQCYSRLFGPQDLRQANLPHRSDVPLSSSPIRTTFTLDQPTSPLKVSRERSKSPEKGGAIATLRSQSRQSQRDSSPGKHTDPVNRLHILSCPIANGILNG